jgi:hypothetical protein
MGEELDPRAVTVALGVEPTRTQVRGELPAPGSKHPYKYSGWFLETQGNVQSRDVRRHIDWLLSKVGGKGAAFSKLRSEGHLTDVCCPWYSIGQGGPTLGAAQIAALSIERTSKGRFAPFGPPLMSKVRQHEMWQLPCAREVRGWVEASC